MAAKFDLIIKNGIVATAGDVGKYDIAVKDGKIAMLAPSIPENATKVIDAQGGYITPGGIDAHVHLAEPSLYAIGACADNYESGSRSAICGGTTTIITFASQRRTDKSLLAVVKDYHQKAENNAYCDYGFHCILAAPSEELLNKELPALVKDGISSVKIYMTYEALRLKDYEILDVLLACRRYGVTCMVHAENGDVVDWMTNQLQMQGLTAPYYHAISRPPLVEAEATNRAISLAEILDVPILLVHVSAPTAANNIRKAQTRGLPIYGETCPQYLFLTSSDLKGDKFEGAKCVCSPPPRESPLDQQAIWRGLSNGTFTIFSSDHAPFKFNGPGGKTEALKPGYDGNFKYIPNGTPGVETRLSLLFSEGVLGGKISAQRFVELTSTNPAKLYGLYPQKGALLPGLSDADLTIWYPDTIDYEVKAVNMHCEPEYTPYEGMKLKNWPRYTVLRGEVVFQEGKLVGKMGKGQFVKRGSSQLAGSRDVWLTEWRPQSV